MFITIYQFGYDIAVTLIITVDMIFVLSIQ